MLYGVLGCLGVELESRMMLGTEGGVTSLVGMISLVTWCVLLRNHVTFISRSLVSPLLAK